MRAGAGVKPLSERGVAKLTLSHRTTSAVCAEDALPSSFRDPAGYVFFRDGLFQRAVTSAGQQDYDHFMLSGLYSELVRERLLLNHREQPAPQPPGIHRILVPQQLEFVSYPYEWGFEQLRDAARLTLDVAECSLRHGMILKDATAFNVQFQGARPVFADTLSFTLDRGGPWVAYEQFCRHFLAPLLLMSHVSPTANQLLRIHLDGIPLDAASRALPWRTWLQPGSFLHLHAHARAVSRSSSRPVPRPARPTAATLPLLQSLRRAVAALRPRREWSQWLQYRQQAAHYPADALHAKELAVQAATESLRPALVYDLGANTGHFSRIAALAGARSIAFEADPCCVDECYLQERRAGSKNLLPLVMDICNPSGPLGFGLNERLSLLERPAAELVLALAVTHHLRLAANVPFHRMAQFFRQLGSALLVEFVEAEDPLAQQILLARSRPLPDDYSLQAFLHAFSRCFELQSHTLIPGTRRWLCLFRATPA